MSHWIRRLPHIGRYTLMMAESQERIMEMIRNAKDDKEVERLASIYNFEEESILNSVRKFWPDEQVEKAIHEKV